MQIIVVDKRLARARTITFTRRHVAIAFSAIVLVVLMMSGMFSFLTVRAASLFPIPVVSDVISFVTRDEMERQDQRVRDNVEALARKLGEVQAQLLRLDALGERVSKVMGIRPEEFRFQELPGRGGALPGADSMTLQDLDVELQRFTRSVEQRADYLAIIEAELRSHQVRQALLPNSKPLADGFVGSGFGWRTDPFTGRMARHEGMDFAAPPGTPTHAAAGVVVLLVDFHPEYGNVVEIDHGNQLMTRYAHALRVNVRTGDLVKRGQKIAEVGSTGRSTGPHLHFEVHSKGVAQNPSKFLSAPGSLLQQQAASTVKVDLKGLAAAAGARN
ncbi:MAG TPA: M23 family metallopeptidase [Burkholderiaceae bacterium]|nr:M23 family metallopeptidase [Burkholderiaceae bacterium]